MAKLHPKVMDVIRAAAPAVATVLGGPIIGGLASIAVETVAKAVGVPADKDPKITTQRIESKVLDVLEGRDTSQFPAEIQVKLQDAEIEFASRAMQHEALLVQLANADRADARDREVQTGDGWTPRLLTFSVMFALFACIAYVITHPLPEGTNEIAWMLIGGLMSAFTQGFAYYLGSSIGSKRSGDAVRTVAVGGR